MLRALSLAVSVLTVCLCASGQASKRPALGTYPARVERPRVRSINFKANPYARTFRTRLSEAIRGGVNFAGHYVVAGWGCGTGCISGAIIDARTGNVFWPVQLYALSVGYDGRDYVGKPVEYRKNSRLLIIRGSPGVKDNDAEKPAGDYYYEWKGNTLKLIRFIPYKAK
jgi:hypothetical protein